MSLDSSSERRRGILLYGMYDLKGLDRAPEVRIAMMTGALSHRVHTERVVGGRIGRTVAAFRWLASGGPRRVGAVYVEASTSAALPGDIAFLALMRLLGRPVGVYFRDAYQFFRVLYPRQHRRQLLTDWIWRVTMPITRGLATHHFVPSEGLAEVMHLRRPILLPPGTEPGAPDQGAGREPLVAYVGGNGWADGFDALVEAMAIVRDRVPSARLLAVTAPLSPERLARLPNWVDLRQAGRAELPDLLREARMCVIPRPITEYTNLAVPVKLFDYLSMGKPIVATDTLETRALIEASGAGTVTPDTAEGLAGGILPILADERLARHFAKNARQYACSPEATWDARARTVLVTLGLADGAAT